MTGINEGAKEYELIRDGDVGVVLVHGFTASPAHVRFVAEDLFNAGYSVIAPLLPGHGTLESELKYADGDKWFGAVSNAIRRMREYGKKRIFCMGHSLGGVLSLLSAENSLCDGVITVAAPIKIYNGIRVKLFTIFCKKKYHVMNKPDGSGLFRYYRADGISIKHLTDTISKTRSKLYKVKVPTLIIYSPEDKTVMPKSADIIYDGIKSGVKDIFKINGGHHQCIIDGRRQYIDTVCKFIADNS